MAQERQSPTPVSAEPDLYFGPFRLERNKRLWRGEHLVALRPRVLAMLRYLAERPGQLVTKEESFTRVWPGVYVTQTVLRVCVHAIRHALQDDPAAPRFIATVGRQGYQFISAVSIRPSPISHPSHDLPECSVASWPLIPQTPPHTLPFVGRRSELARLPAAFARAQQGERQVMFLFGEPGIGKTMLVDRFLTQVQERGSVRIGRGQCIELHGPGEAYLPILDALGQLCQEGSGGNVLTMLRHSAPQASSDSLDSAGSLDALPLSCGRSRGVLVL